MKHSHYEKEGGNEGSEEGGGRVLTEQRERERESWEEWREGVETKQMSWCGYLPRRALKRTETAVFFLKSAQSEKRGRHCHTKTKSGI